MHERPCSLTSDLVFRFYLLPVRTRNIQSGQPCSCRAICGLSFSLAHSAHKLFRLVCLCEAEELVETASTLTKHMCSCCVVRNMRFQLGQLFDKHDVSWWLFCQICITVGFRIHFVVFMNLALYLIHILLPAAVERCIVSTSGEGARN